MQKISATRWSNSMPFAERPTRRRYGRRWNDEKAPDGFIVSGWRRVTKGGYITFCNGKHYHDLFKEWAGLWVYAQINDWVGLTVDVWPNGPSANSSDRICCFNESDWKSENPVESAIRSRSRCPA
jgi:hypothetical protein